MPDSSTQAPWWGQVQLTEGSVNHWRIGPLALSLQRLVHEWQLEYRQVGDDEASETELPVDGKVARERFVAKDTNQPLWIHPALADRPVVSRPNVPFHLLPGQQIQLFVSSPLWVVIEQPDSGLRLREMPIQRPSDTWFGPSTQVGELCYAARTDARLDLGEVPFRSYRAVTPLVLHNHGSDALLLERLSLPIPYLSLYADAGGRLWTEGLRIVRSEDLATATMEIASGAPEHLAEPERLATARKEVEKRVLVRALNSLLG